MIYTLKQGNKTVSVQSKRRWYVIGFPSITHARAVHYNIAPEPTTMFLYKDTDIQDEQVMAYMQSALYLPKHTGDHWHSMNDGNFHIHAVQKKEFYDLPRKGLGIVYAHNLRHEDAHEFTFDAHVFEPISDEGSEL